MRLYPTLSFCSCQLQNSQPQAIDMFSDKYSSTTTIFFQAVSLISGFGEEDICMIWRSMIQALFVSIVLLRQFFFKDFGIWENSKKFVHLFWVNKPSRYFFIGRKKKNWIERRISLSLLKKFFENSTSLWPFCFYDFFARSFLEKIFFIVLKFFSSKISNNKGFFQVK